MAVGRSTCRQSGTCCLSLLRSPLSPSRSIQLELLVDLTVSVGNFLLSQRQGTRPTVRIHPDGREVHRLELLVAWHSVT